MTARDRARVPFAVIGVLLLVSSATIAGTMGPTETARDPAVEQVLDRATATVNAELRGAVDDAAAAAAATPVIDPANTSYGAVLEEGAPFRSALRTMVYVETRRRLAGLDRRRGDVAVTATLPATPNATALSTAMDRVHLERAGVDGSALRARISNLTLTVWRDGRIVATRSLSPRVTVATPVMAMHDRVAEYERRLNAGITTPGLSQRLTAAISAVAWARGWAQYGGAPIRNVLANRHVEIATNAAALDLQRTTIGHVDPDGLRRATAAGLGVATQDILAATDPPERLGEAGDRVASEIRHPGDARIEAFDPPGADQMDDEIVVGINRTADDAYLDYLDGGLESTIQRVYTANGRLRAAVRNERGSPAPPPPSPGPRWELVANSTRRSTTVTPADGPAPRALPPWERIDGFVRTVRIDHERERRWVRGNETRTTTTESTQRATVRIALMRSYGDTDAYWDRSVAGLYGRDAGALAGPNLAGIDDRARDRLLGDRGGVDGVATRALRQGGLDEQVKLTGDRPEGLRAWIVADLNELRHRLRNESDRFRRTAVASFEVNPPGALSDRIEQGRRAIVDPPPEFDGVADRARIAARAAYLSAVKASLDERARSHAGRRAGLGAHLPGQLSPATLPDHAGLTPELRESRGPALRGPGGPVRLRVDAAPSYLSLLAVEEDSVPAADGSEHPLVARNVNVFAVPHGGVEASAGNASVGLLETTRLQTAAQTLRATNDTLARAENATLAQRRDVLASAVASGAGAVRTRLVETLRKETDADRGEARRIVRAGLGEWAGTDARALALANGSAAGPIAEHARERLDLPAHEADRLGLRLDRAAREAAGDPAGRPSALAVELASRSTEAVAGSVTERVTEGHDSGEIANLTGFANRPAGLPLLPVPGHWYATVNVWTVTVRGEYARFGARATRADPTTPGAELSYVRDGANVTLDVDRDGEEELLGRASRVRFTASAGTAVLVPPGAQGVGDVTGERNETSAGWPDPGPN